MAVRICRRGPLLIVSKRALTVGGILDVFNKLGLLTTPLTVRVIYPFLYVQLGGFKN